MTAVGERYDRELRQREAAARDKLRTMSNWGRWGDDDERGAANLVDAAASRRGLAAVKTAAVYPLGSEIRGAGMGMYHSTRPNATAPKLLGVAQPLHYFRADGGDAALGLVNQARHLAEDTVMIPVQGATSHIDSLAHVSVNGELYNGQPSSVVKSYGALKLGIENVAALITRGVLLDLARFRGKDVCDADDYITADDLRACAAESGIEFAPGDAVLIRTGWPKVFAEDPVRYSTRQPGLGSSAALLLAERDVALVGSDNSEIEPYDGSDPEVMRPGARHDIYLAHASSLEPIGSDPRREFATDLHETLVRNLGMYLVEMLDLEQIATARVTEFLFILAPLLIRGATGSPVNPLAVA
jgi:kynurenine formamidase